MVPVGPSSLKSPSVQLSFIYNASVTFKIEGFFFTETRPDTPHPPTNKQHSKENTLLTGRNLKLDQVHILGVGGTLLMCSEALKRIIYILFLFICWTLEWSRFAATVSTRKWRLDISFLHMSDKDAHRRGGGG